MNNYISDLNCGIFSEYYNIQYALINNNVILDNFYSIRLNSSNNIIINNICNDSSNTGIYLNLSSDNVIVNNQCNNNDYCNIRLRNNSKNNLITNNFFKDSINNVLIETNYNTIIGNSCINGTGLTTDYTSSQYTIKVTGSKNLISSNMCLGKAVVDSGTSNTEVNNKFE